MFKENSAENLFPRPETSEKKDLPSQETGEKNEKFEQAYEAVVQARDERYAEDIKLNQNAEKILPALNKHNEIVQNYALELSEEMEKEGVIDKKQGVAIRLATILHDGGKLNSGLLEHHKKGAEYAKEILERISEEQGSIEGVSLNSSIISGEGNGKEITSLKNKIIQAIERHMNHPFLVMLNKGEAFPQPQDNVDRVVFDSDMLANIGFKNVAFRLADDNNVKEDKAKAQAQNKPYIQEVVDNIMDGDLGVKGLKKVMLTEAGSFKAEKLIKEVEEIYKNLNFQELQEKIDKEKMGIKEVRNFLNQEIEKAGENLSDTAKFKI